MAVVSLLFEWFWCNQDCSMGNMDCCTGEDHDSAIQHCVGNKEWHNMMKKTIRFVPCLTGEYGISQNWKLLESVFCHFLKKLEIARIEKCQNWKLSESEIVRIRHGHNWKLSKTEFVTIGNCQSWNLSELEIVRIGTCQNWNLSELEFVRIRNRENWKLSEFQNGQNQELRIVFSLKLLMIVHIYLRLKRDVNFT